MRATLHEAMNESFLYRIKCFAHSVEIPQKCLASSVISHNDP
jgi:hypothetical protein